MAKEKSLKTVEPEEASLVATTEQKAAFEQVKADLITKKKNLADNFYQTGRLLARVQNEKLYLAEHASFNDFLKKQEMYPNGYKMIRLAKIFPDGLPVGIMKAEKVARICELNPKLADKAIEVAQKTPLSKLDETLAEEFKEDYKKLHASPQQGHLHFAGDEDQIKQIKKAIEVLIKNRPDDYGNTPLEVLEGLLANAITAENLTGEMN